MSKNNTGAYYKSVLQKESRNHGQTLKLVTNFSKVWKMETRLGSGYGLINDFKTNDLIEWFDITFRDGVVAYIVWIAFLVSKIMLF